MLLALVLIGKNVYRCQWLLIYRTPVNVLEHHQLPSGLKIKNDDREIFVEVYKKLNANLPIAKIYVSVVVVNAAK